jgi:predicted nucleotidyltransferase
MAEVRTIADALKSLSDRYRLLAVYVFGSRAAEINARVEQDSVPQDKDSDVDIGVQPRKFKRLSVKEKSKLSIELEDLLGVSRVDLVVIPEADPFLAVDIIRGELLYCFDFDELSELELYVLRRAADLAYYKRERIHHILGGRHP